MVLARKRFICSQLLEEPNAIVGRQGTSTLAAPIQVDMTFRRHNKIDVLDH